MRSVLPAVIVAMTSISNLGRLRRHDATRIIDLAPKRRIGLFHMFVASSAVMIGVLAFVTHEKGDPAQVTRRAAAENA